MPTYLRGFLPSLGAGGSLIGASLVVAAILSSVIAFQGWPGAVFGGDGGSVALQGAPPARPAPARTQAAPATRVDGVTAPAAARRRGAAPRSAGSGPTARRRGSAPARRPVATSPAPTTPAVSSPSSPSGGAPTPSSAPHSTPPSSPPTSPPGGGSGPLPDRSVGSVVDTVQQAVPPVPAPVQPVVDTVDRVTDDTAATVDGVVGGLVP